MRTLKFIFTFCVRILHLIACALYKYASFAMVIGLVSFGYSFFDSSAKHFFTSYFFWIEVFLIVQFGIIALLKQITDV